MAYEVILQSLAHSLQCMVWSRVKCCVVINLVKKYAPNGEQGKMIQAAIIALSFAWSASLCLIPLACGFYKMELNEFELYALDTEGQFVDYLLMFPPAKEINFSCAVSSFWNEYECCSHSL